MRGTYCWPSDALLAIRGSKKVSSISAAALPLKRDSLRHVHAMTAFLGPSYLQLKRPFRIAEQIKSATRLSPSSVRVT
jgi:hypothetical protein